jgi:hypothetical protein
MTNAVLAKLFVDLVDGNHIQQNVILMDLRWTNKMNEWKGVWKRIILGLLHKYLQDLGPWHKQLNVLWQSNTHVNTTFGAYMLCDIFLAWNFPKSSTKTMEANILALLELFVTDHNVLGKRSL